MAGIKNKYEFYKGSLEALGAEDVNETDYKNEEEFKRNQADFFQSVKADGFMGFGAVSCPTTA